MTHNTCDVTLFCTPFCIVSLKEKEKKKKIKLNINNDLAILPSHDKSVGIKYIKCYLPWKIRLQHNSTLS